MSEKASKAFAITPNDSTDLTTIPSNLYVGGAGDLKVTLVKDSAPVTFKNVPAGTRLDIQVKRVYATGTTATFILGLNS